MRRLAEAIPRVLLGGWPEPPLRWAPDRDLGLALGGVGLIVVVNLFKLGVPAWRDAIDWFALNVGVFWLLPLLWIAARQPRPIVGARPGPWRLLIGLLVIAQIPFGGESAIAWNLEHWLGGLGYLYFQVTVQLAEVLFFFVFLHPRAVRCLGSLGAVPLTVAALCTMQATSTDPLLLQCWIDNLGRAALEVCFFAMVPSVGAVFLFEVLAGGLGELRLVQIGVKPELIAVEQALWASVSMALYALTLGALLAGMGAIAPGRRSRRLRGWLLGLCIATGILAAAGWFGFQPQRARLHPDGTRFVPWRGEP